MGPQEREKFKQKLLDEKHAILNKGMLKSKEGLSVASEDLPDEADLANNIIQQEVSFNIREMELNKLRLIEEALNKIESGTYGQCDECDSEIKHKRLENQPWANLCLAHAEEKEREISKQHAKSA